MVTAAMTTIANMAAGTIQPAISLSLQLRHLAAYIFADLPRVQLHRTAYRLSSPDPFGLGVSASFRRPTPLAVRQKTSFSLR
jgi:hypothetical protein